MSKELQLSQEDLEKMIFKAVEKTRLSVNEESIEASGCDFTCVIKHEVYIRNDTRNIMSLKTWCMQNNYNHRDVFDILKDLMLIETIKQNYNILTDEGFEALNTRDKQFQPYITCIDGHVFINDKDIRHENFIQIIENHRLFSGSSYNKKIKSRSISYSRRELVQAKELGIEITEIKEIEG